MKIELDIYTELNDIVNAMKEAINIVSIGAAVDGVQTIVVDTVVLFDNLSRAIKLTNGMIITINEINYSVSNVIDTPSVNSFDVSATDLTIENEEAYNVAANFQTGTLKEINEILNSESGNENRFPLIWLLPTVDLDRNKIVLDFTASVTLVFAHKANDTDRTVKRIESNFIPVLQPFRTLFEAWMQSSDFNYMLEFNGFGKPIDNKESDLPFFGNDNKTKSILDTVSSDAKRIVYELNFKKQFFRTVRIIPPPAPFPPVIEDGNTVAWYIADDLETITKDGSDFVSQWNDKLGSGDDLLQALEPNRPKWVLDDGILFDGIDNFMKTLPFTWAPPMSIYFVFKQITRQSSDQLMDGSNFQILQASPSPNININTYTGAAVSLALDTYGILRINGDPSSLNMQINEGLKSNGTCTIVLNQFVLASHAAGGIRFSNIQVKEILLRKIADVEEDEQDIYDYLADKYGI